MGLWYAVFLGVLQGLTEFFPISSTAHLRVVPALLGREDPGAALTAILQLGSLLALLVYFRRDCWEMGREGMGLLRGRPANPARARLLGAVILGTVPIAVFGYAFRQGIKAEARHLGGVAAALIGVGVLLWLCERRAKLARGEEEVTVWDGLWIGLAQSLALIPGVSRSGISIAAGLLLGFRRDAAARVSFLLGIPALFAAGVFEFWETRSAWTGEAAGWLLAGVAAAFASSLLTIHALLRYLRTRSTLPFVVYRIALGAAILILLGQGFLNPF